MKEEQKQVRIIREIPEECHKVERLKHCEYDNGNKPVATNSES